MTTTTTTNNNAGGADAAATAAVASATNATAAAAAAAALPNNIPAAAAAAAADPPGLRFVFHPTMMQQPPNNNSSNKRTHAQAFSQSQFAQALNQAMNLQAAAAIPAVKAEPSDPETTPQNPAEASAFRQLQAMQFSDPREILQAYRKLLAQKGGTTPPSVDEVMVYLITQREEAEEAAKMDAARLASERSRKHDAEERRAELRRQLQDDMEQASVAEWRTDERMFVHSWLLEHAELRGVVEEQLRKQTCTNGTSSPLKLELIQLLQLEKKARQWYRATLPKAYFGGPVTDRLLRASSSDENDRLLEQVRREIQTLHTGLYELEHQVGGVPVIFRDAHDDAEESNDDDEVRVMFTTTNNNGRAADPAGAEEETSEPSLPNPNQAPAAAAPEIVDIT